MIFSWKKQSQQCSSASSGRGLGFSEMLLETQCPLFQLLMHIPSHKEKKNPCIASVLVLTRRKGMAQVCLCPGVHGMESLGWKHLSPNALEMPRAARGRGI